MYVAQQWRHMPFIPALERQKQQDLCQFNANLVYRVNSRVAKATERNFLLKKQKLKTETDKTKQKEVTK